MLNQTFGIELECFAPRGLTMDMVASMISEAGVTTRAEGYNHNLRSNWKIVTDGSLMGGGMGMEIVSPVLTGEEGLRQIRIVCQTLSKIGCTINRTCGMHVHVGARNRRLDFFKRLLKAYAHFEAPIDGTLPRSRRGDANGYCRTLRGLDRDIDAATTIDALVRMFSRRHNRYYKLNVQSFLRHGTVEFRHHSGTVDPDKAEAWVKFCLAMCHRADRAEMEATAEPVPIVYRGNQVTPQGWPGRYAQVQAMRRPEGATDAELCAIAGVKVAGANMACTLFGYRLVTTTIGGVRRHFAVAPGGREMPLPAATLEGLIEYAALPSPVASHFRARTAHFASRA